METIIMTLREGRILDSISESDFQIAFFDEIVDGWDVIDDHTFNSYEEAHVALTAYGNVWADSYPPPFQIVRIEGYVKLVEVFEDADLTPGSEVAKVTS
jgi:hypothetical protein